MLAPEKSIYDFSNLRIPFRYLNNNAYPALDIQCSVGEQHEFHLIGIIDTGAVYSIFNGYYLMNLQEGEKFKITSNIPGQILTTYIHKTEIRFPHFDFLPKINLDVRYSEENIPRNLLGRDFLNKFYLIFAEHYQCFDLLKV